MSAKKKPATRCPGFGETAGKCCEEAGCQWTPDWCPACDRVRRAALTVSVEKWTDNEEQNSRG